MGTFETPTLDKNFKIVVEGEEAKELFIDHQTRNGKYVNDQLARLIWAKHELPMYRGTIVDAVPFRLRILQVLFDYKNYGIAATYQFIAN